MAEALLQERERYAEQVRHQSESMRARLLKGELRHLLNRWGQFMSNTADRNGLPTACAFTRIPGTQAGHRILCADMPKPVYFINQAILRLEPQSQRYLHAWYAWQRDEYGRWLEQSEKVLTLGISYNEFCLQIHRARKKLLTLRKFWLV